MNLVSKVQSTATFWAILAANLLILAMLIAHPPAPGTSHLGLGLQTFTPKTFQIEDVARPPIPKTVRPAPTAPPYSERQLAYVQKFVNHKTAVAVLTAVHKVAADRGIDPRVVLAIIKPESTFKPHAKSPGGDHGLMQVRVRYHQDRMARLGVTNIYDIEQNIRVGVDILVEYKGQTNLYRALVRYTGGSQKGAQRIIDLANHIPA